MSEMTIERLIADYESSVKVFDHQIDYLEAGGRIAPVGEDPERATIEWLAKLKQMKADHLTIINGLRARLATTPT